MDMEGDGKVDLSDYSDPTGLKILAQRDFNSDAVVLPDGYVLYDGGYDPATAIVADGVYTVNSPHTYADGDADHLCDYDACAKEIGTHADAGEDADHVCDYGCGALLEKHRYENACDDTCNVCGEGRTPAAHESANADGICDACGVQFELSGGVIAGIASCSVAAVGVTGFAIFWFVIKKKKWSDLVGIFKKQ